MDEYGSGLQAGDHRCAERIAGDGSPTLLPHLFAPDEFPKLRWVTDVRVRVRSARVSPQSVRTSQELESRGLSGLCFSEKLFSGGSGSFFVF